MKNYLIVVLVVILLSGCSRLLSQKTAELAPTEVTHGKGEMVTLPAQLRIITNKNKEGSYISCAEPGPDVALSDTFKMITGITSDTSSSINSGADSSAAAGNKATFNNNLQTSTTALELAGRTQTVLLAREFLYRTCEAAANGWITGAEVKAAQDQIVGQITKLINTDNKKAEAAAAVAGAFATGKLDPAILGHANAAVFGAIRANCVQEFEDCLARAKVDKAVCRSEFNKCIE